MGPFSDIAQSQDMFVELQATGYVRYEDLPLRTISGAKIDVEFVCNAYDCEGTKVIQCNIREIGERKAALAIIERQTKHYSALSHCNKAIVYCTREDELFQQVCRVAVQFGGMTMAWIGMIDADTRQVRPVARYGDAAEFIENIDISIDSDRPIGRGPTGTAIRASQPVWCQDFLNDPLTASWHERAANAGVAAAASLPLHRNGVVIGAFILYSGTLDAFDQTARDLLEEMASDICFALDNFDREVQARRAEEQLLAAEEKFRGLVEQPLTGILIIQDGQLIYANPRCAEIVDQGSVEALIGSDPLQWVIEAERAQVAENLRRLYDGAAQSVAFDFGVLRLDGATIQIGTNAARATHDGRPAIIGMVQDISEKKRDEEKIRRHVAQLKTALMSTVEVATIISEMRDPYTAGHERRVAEIAVAIGAELGFDTARLEGLHVAGHLHDIGKITIPAEILAKPGGNSRQARQNQLDRVPADSRPCTGELRCTEGGGFPLAGCAGGPTAP
jgi:PAS domain S-box-containing protein